MEHVTMALKAAFIITTLLAVYLFYRARNQSRAFLLLALIWMAIQLCLGLAGFYQNQSTTPPRFILLILPPFLLIAGMLLTSKGRKFMDGLNLKQLTLLHTIRIPVEIVLYYLFIAKVIPKIMTFEGSNFDIISGLTAPLIYYLGFTAKKFSNSITIIWNVLCLGLLINIIILAIFSTKTSFQQFGFDQPNIAITHFPFNWLASVIVPLVLFSHVATLRKVTVVRNKSGNR
jgi:hypothetical protein